MSDEQATVPSDPHERAQQRLTMDYEVPVLAEPSGDGTVRGIPNKTSSREELRRNTQSRTTTVVRNLAPEDIDLAQVQADFERHLDRLLSQWRQISAIQRAELVDQIAAALSRDDLEALAALSVQSQDAAQELLQAMMDMAQAAAQRVVDEAAQQQVNLNAVEPKKSWFASAAATAAAMLATSLANAAGREAARRWTRGGDAKAVAQAVGEHLAGLSDAFLRDELGGALSQAETTGRMQTMLAGPSAALYGSEMLDGSTCRPCREINGKWLGNSDDPNIDQKVAAVYPRGYVSCLGGDRCRGQVVAVWRPAQSAPGEQLPAQ